MAVLALYSLVSRRFPLPFGPALGDCALETLVRVQEPSKIGVCFSGAQDLVGCAFLGRRKSRFYRQDSALDSVSRPWGAAHGAGLI